jgi:hypothetical protein
LSRFGVETLGGGLGSLCSDSFVSVSDDSSYIGSGGYIQEFRPDTSCLTAFVSSSGVTRENSESDFLISRKLARRWRRRQQRKANVMVHNKAHAPMPSPTVEAVDNLMIGCGEGLTLDVSAGRLVGLLIVEPVIRATVPIEEGVDTVDTVDEGNEDVRLIAALPIVDVPYM